MTDTEKAANDFLSSYEGGTDWDDLVRIFEAGAEWGKEKHGVKILESDCICQYDQYGGMTNPKCIVHGSRDFR